MEITTKSLIIKESLLLYKGLTITSSPTPPTGGAFSIGFDVGFLI